MYKEKTRERTQQINVTNTHEEIDYLNVEKEKMHKNSIKHIGLQKQDCEAPRTLLN